MHIHLSPTRADDTLALHRTGEVLAINGLAFDFGPLPEGATLPQGAVGCPALADDITRQDGQVRLVLRLPYGGDADAAALFPAPLADPPDGPVPLPGHPGAAGPATTPGVIDWAQMVTTADRLAAATRAAEAQLAAAIEAAILARTGTLPPSEPLSWTAKEDAARAWLAGAAEAGQRALLESEAAMTGEPLDTLAGHILAKAEAWRQTIGRLSGLRRRTAARLQAAPDLGALAAALDEGLALLDRG
jgi:hypothetical protein